MWQVFWHALSPAAFSSPPDNNRDKDSGIAMPENDPVMDGTGLTATEIAPDLRRFLLIITLAADEPISSANV